MFKVVDVTMSPDASILASGDVTADTQIIKNVCRGAGNAVKLVSFTIIDQDDQKALLDVYFHSGSGTMGTENGAPSISDANALEILGRINVPVADYKDLGGVAVATYANQNIILAPASGSSDIYVSIVNGTGTPTYTAAGLILRLGIEY